MHRYGGSLVDDETGGPAPDRCGNQRPGAPACRAT